MDLNNFFFITGFPRSGTTLIERFLGNQDGFYVAHQVFPTLFINVKKEFLRKNNIKREYPFIPNPDELESKKFLEFLKKKEFTDEQVRKWMNEGEHYPAMGEKAFLANLKPKGGKLIEVIVDVLTSLAPKGAVFYGFKDVLMDEFIPYFESYNIKTVFVVRDPRSVIYSLVNSNEMGDYRPTLYNLQLWKRGLRNAIKNNAFVLRYEDFITDSKKTTFNLSFFFNAQLHLDVFPLKNNKGGVWSSNSSFWDNAFLSNSSINAYKNEFSLSTTAYIESICFNEMNSLKYDLSISKKVDIKDLKEPFEVTHTTFKNWDNQNELLIEFNF